MPTEDHTHTEDQEAASQTGANDHLEQAAADLASQKHRRPTDEDRKAAYEQARKTSPPAKSSPPTPEDG